jgi:hypothetical protein
VVKWQAFEDEDGGGFWCIAEVDRRVGIASELTEEDAKHIVELHNESEG